MPIDGGTAKFKSAIAEFLLRLQMFFDLCELIALQPMVLSRLPYRELAVPVILLARKLLANERELLIGLCFACVLSTMPR